jgi:suppressor of G2 allele of SKP1
MEEKYEPNVRPMKIEFVLKKKVCGLKWPNLGGDPVIQILSSTGDQEMQPPPTSQGKEDTQDTSLESIATANPLLTTPTISSKPPSYPTSSRTGPKDWDKIASENLKKIRATSIAGTTPAHKETPPATDASSPATSPEPGNDVDDDDEDEGDPVNHFFRKLYKGADDDTRRAMMKSYMESNGTALSTNWSEVKKGKVETKPPEGMEAKRWDE